MDQTERRLKTKSPRHLGKALPAAWLPPWVTGRALLAQRGGNPVVSVHWAVFQDPGCGWVRHETQPAAVLVYQLGFVTSNVL